MRNGQNNNNNNNKRMRGRNRKSHSPLTRVYESNGPDVKIRGTANHIAEKYVQLARDAQTSGDPVAAENYHQHAEHYLRLIASAQEQFRQTQPFRPDGSMADPRDDGGDEGDDDDGMNPSGVSDRGGDQPSYGTRDPQPYLPRDAQFYSPREAQRETHREVQREAPREPHREVQREMPRETHREVQREVPREQPSFSGRHPRNPTPSNDADDDGNVERLPSFITGGAAGPQPAPVAAPTHAGGAQNGYEGQGDRFPLHRRRRRHRGPRENAPQGASSLEGADDASQAPRPIGD